MTTNLKKFGSGSYVQNLLCPGSQSEDGGSRGVELRPMRRHLAGGKRLSSWDLHILWVYTNVQSGDIPLID
uniref:Uncharacterized protein n=1 Tax=Romanomermis culicivorax TaxID=13658 RepID=A0A915J2B3_ROMCU